MVEKYVEFVMVLMLDTVKFMGQHFAKVVRQRDTQEVPLDQLSLAVLSLSPFF